MSGYTVQGFNPFLSDSDVQPQIIPNYGSSISESAAIASNPFLSGDFSYQPPIPQHQITTSQAVMGGGENPFLFTSSNPDPLPQIPMNFGAGNPFADFVTPAPVPSYGGNEASWNPMQTSYGSIGEMDLNPVSSSTQDLLSTVTGALEATSDSLLDRLRNQPSPIPQPPSPTPSPRSPSPDLLMGDEDFGSMFIHPSPVIPLTQKQPMTIDLMGLYSASSNVETRSQPPLIPESSSNPLSFLLDEQDEIPPVPHVSHPVENIIDISSEPDPILTTTEPQVSIFPTSIPEFQANFTAKAEPEVEILPPEVPKMESHAPPPRPPQPPPPRPLPSRPPPPVPRKDPPSIEIPSRPVPSFQPPPSVSPIQSSSPFPISSPFESSPIPDQPPSSPYTGSPFFTPSTSAITVATGQLPELPPPRVFPPVSPQSVPIVTQPRTDFDAFEDRFNNMGNEGDGGTAFGSSAAFGDTTTFGGGGFDAKPSGISAWGDDSFGCSSGRESSSGFGNEDKFDEFLALREPPPVPQSTPAKSRLNSGSDDFDKPEVGLSITIRQRDTLDFNLEPVPTLAPPPKSPAISTGSAFEDSNSSSFIPFLSSVKVSTTEDGGTGVPRSDSQDSPQTPLFEEDMSQPLEEFPRIKYSGDGWEMHMRHPNKKKITGQRFWKKVYVRMITQNDVLTVQVYNTSKDKDPIQEIPLQPCYSVSDISAQQFDQYGKIFTVKLQYIFYKERPGVRPGQITKAERITNKLSQFAAYAIQGDYQGVKEFGSDLKKLGLPLEHAPQVSQLIKLGTQNYEEMKHFSMLIEEALFRLPVNRDRALQYKSEEVQVTLVDEYYVEQDTFGVVTRQIARVRLYFLSFLSGAAEVELGINDIKRQGKEVVGRHDIIPIATEEWIRIEDIEFSTCVQLNVFEETKMVKFKPPDACYIELLRFRVRPPRHRELPLQVKTVFTTTGHRIEIRCDLLVPGFTSRKLGQIPCEDVMVRIPIPEAWIYMFRVEKHFRYGSVKSAHRRSGKVKGIERFLGAVEAVENSLMEVTSGQAKYEHQHKAIVWRISRLPKEGQGAYTTHSFFCHVTLQPHEEVPSNLAKCCYIEFTMPHTTISHTVCRSVSVPNCDEPPEKCVKYLSRHEYVVEIEHAQGILPASYNLAATVVKEAEPKQEEPMEGKALSDSDFSDD